LRDAEFAPLAFMRHPFSLFGCLTLTHAAPVLGAPLNPLTFPSLGAVVLEKGEYSIDSAAAVPKILGPDVQLQGTVSSSGVAVFRFESLTVRSGAVFRTSGGIGARPIAFLSSGDLSFAGALRANGSDGTDAGIEASGKGGEGGAGSGKN